MKTYLAVYAFILFPATVYAQTSFRPVLDPTALCNQQMRPEARILNPGYENKEEPHMQYEIFYVVEKMPAPETSINEIERILEEEIRFIRLEKTFNNAISFQCIINCKGEAGDFQINSCPEEFANTGHQVLNVLQTHFNNWRPGVQRDKNVDVLIGIKVKVNEGKFKVEAPVSFT